MMPPDNTPDNKWDPDGHKLGWEVDQFAVATINNHDYAGSVFRVMAVNFEPGVLATLTLKRIGQMEEYPIYHATHRWFRRATGEEVAQAVKDRLLNIKKVDEIGAIARQYGLFRKPGETNEELRNRILAVMNTPIYQQPPFRP